MTSQNRSPNRGRQRGLFQEDSSATSLNAGAAPTPVQLLNNLYRLALNRAAAKVGRLRLCLAFPCRGQRVRLFYGHGPWGSVIERGTSATGDYTVAEFDVFEVLQATGEKLGV